MSVSDNPCMQYGSDACQDFIRGNLSFVASLDEEDFLITLLSFLPYVIVLVDWLKRILREYAHVLLRELR